MEQKKEPIQIALIGNPNTGKTTLFNAVTKSNQHVGNWHGVTVDKTQKQFNLDKILINLIDLPGTYSTCYLTFDEKVTTDFLQNNFDIPIINICDASNLERNLFLTLELISKKKRTVLYVNKMGNKKIKLDAKMLSKKLGIQVFVGNAENANKDKQFLNSLSNIKCSDRQFYFDDNNFENKANQIYSEIEEICNSINITNDKNICKCNQTKKLGIIDKIVLNKLVAFPIFMLVMIVIFYITFFSLGKFLSQLLTDCIQNLIAFPFAKFLISIKSPAWVVGLFSNAIIGGAGALLCFLPQIALLFFFISILEDSGYLSRIAFLFEDIFSHMGLSGKSIYTLLLGMGCATTATLTARNMDDKNAKIKTAMLTPYMSCSAKLPIYAVIGGTFFGVNNVFVVFSLYALGLIVALLVSLMLEKTSLKSQSHTFILEFPEYRFPSLKRLLKLLYENIKMFIIRVTSVLISVNIIIWILQSFTFNFAYIETNGGTSILQHISTWLAPIFSPLGFGNWGAVAALIVGLVAKEIIVSTIGMINGLTSLNINFNNSISNSILNPASVIFFTPASAMSFLVFCLLYSPCVATFAVLKKEIGKRWTLISIILQFTIAYILSFIIFNLMKIFINVSANQIIFSTIGVITIILFSIILIKNKQNLFCKNCKQCKNNKN
ncbi:MAG: ferrous iron transporter B, partial [Clostridia bacterium]